MDLSVAVRLIEPGVDKSINPQVWADLGAGSGLFTKALSSVIDSGVIYAVDKNNMDFSTLDKKVSVNVKKIKADFTADNLSIEPCDGILMANSLHYVTDKLSFLQQIKKYLKATGVLIIIEYERNTANAWVPYPIRFRDLEKLIRTIGFSSFKKIGEEPSIFDDAMMYAVLINS